MQNICIQSSVNFPITPTNNRDQTELRDDQWTQQSVCQLGILFIIGMILLLIRSGGSLQTDAMQNLNMEAFINNCLDFLQIKAKGGSLVRKVGNCRNVYQVPSG